MRTFIVFFLFLLATSAAAADVPLPLSSYQDIGMPLTDRLFHRIKMEPFNIVAAIIFGLAIIHTFFAGYFRALSKKWQAERVKELNKEGVKIDFTLPTSFRVQAMHFLGEVEAIFGIWVLGLMAAITYFHGWQAAKEYIAHGVNFTEPMFIVVILAIASTRPILKFSEDSLRKLASLGKQSIASWWLVILTFAPILGSFITEPAAMTIAALLMGKQFYVYRPKSSFKYASLGLLFVNVSVGGTITNFAAPPILMVASKWEWSSFFVFSHLGWKAVVGIVVANTLFFFVFRNHFKELESNKRTGKEEPRNELEVENNTPIPVWITFFHVLFLGWTVYTAHYPPLFIGGFLFFIAFMSMTDHHQDELHLHSPLLVGFFLGGLVIHGGVQGWWIEPLLGSMSEVPLFISATILTSFNDNAAITYLATLVPNFSDSLKYAVVAGAVAGGGLTVIANAPNPAGQAILSKYFPNHLVSPLGLCLGALIPTIIMICCFMFL